MSQDKFTETELENLDALWRQMSMVRHYSLHGLAPLADSVPGLIAEIRRLREHMGGIAVESDEGANKGEP